MQTDKARAVSHEGDILKIDGKSVRMEFMVRDAFWSNGKAVVLLDPGAFLDEPSGTRKRSRDPVKNLRAYEPTGRLLWEAEQPEVDDHYYLIESREPLVALSFSAFRCDLDIQSGKILRKHKLK
jgi:hypothetical protein